MKKFNGNWKIMLFLLLLAAAAPLFAQNGDLGTLGLSGMESLAKNIQGIFTGTLVKIILICCLAGCGIAYAYNKDNEAMKKKVIAITIGIGIITAASVIVDKIFTTTT